VKTTKKKFDFWKFCGIVWILCILVFAFTFLFATNFLHGQIQSTSFGNSKAFILFFAGSIVLGIISFGLMVLSFLYENVKNKKILTIVLIVLFLLFGLRVFLLIRSISDQTGKPITSMLNPPKSTTTAQEIIDFTNKERVNAGLKPLTDNPKLDEAAQLRAQKIIDFNEWNHEATKSGVPYTKAIKEVNYWNISYGENLAKGFYDSQSVVDAWMNSPGHKENLLNPKFQEIGIGILDGNVDGEQTQVVVQLFGGFQPPNYKQADIDSWKTGADSLRNILPSWEKIKNFSTTYSENKADADRLLEIINTRITRDESIYTTMKANKWLSSQQNKWVKEETGLYNEEEAISKKLNVLTWH
jgi:uncharacterized protein YkwD